MNTAQSRFYEKFLVHPSSRCWIWHSARDTDGYGVLTLSGPPKKLVKAHRLSWEIHHGDIPSNLGVLHICDKPSCVNPEHLFLGTSADNVKDKVAKNRQAAGSRVNTAKLTEEQVREIRSINGLFQREIAEKFGVTQSVISHILTGRTWKCLR